MPGGLSNSLKQHALEHLQWFLEHAAMRGRGPQDGPLWMSSLSLASGKPLGPERPSHVAKRCYRLIESPWGSNLYWDLPLVAACHLASEYTGDSFFEKRAADYIRGYLSHCRSASGLFWWANHYYFDAKLDGPVFFLGNEEYPKPVDPGDPCPYHETRPLRVPWELLWRAHPEAVSASIRAQASSHLVDANTGEFNRHADRKAEHPFLEAGGILAESLCWLASKEGDDSLAGIAARMLGFSFEARNTATGLLPVSPRLPRWDFDTATSETGLWAGCALRCHDLSGRPLFAEYASKAMAAWLQAAWDPEAERYLGRLKVRTGTADRSPQTTPYQPGEYSDPWEPLFPAHDYPLQAAEASLQLYLRTRDALFHTSVDRWLRHFERSLPARHGRGGYAEHYGRMLHWLGGAEAAGWSRAGQLRRRLLEEVAGTLLFESSLFRSHPEEDRCDAVDGMGFLLWALIEDGTCQSRPWEPW